MAALSTDFLDEHLAGLRAGYRAKLDVLTSALVDGFGDRASLHQPSGGMFVWLRTPGVDTAAWLGRATGRGVCFVPGEAFAVDTNLSDRVRRSFVTPSEHQLAEGATRLAATIDAA